MRKVPDPNWENISQEYVKNCGPFWALQQTKYNDSLGLKIGVHHDDTDQVIKLLCLEVGGGHPADQVDPQTHAKQLEHVAACRSGIYFNYTSILTIVKTSLIWKDIIEDHSYAEAH